MTILLHEELRHDGRGRRTQMPPKPGRGGRMLPMLDSWLHAASSSALSSLY